MKYKLKKIISAAAVKAYEKGELPSGDIPDITVDEPKNISQGDFSTNLSMVMAKQQKMAPRKIAEIILANLEDKEGVVEKTEVAGPGFINFFIAKSAWLPVIESVNKKGRQYGSVNLGNGLKVQVEFVSANPTGPLHVGHGRGAAVGDSVANILSFTGYDVQREYYINDSGRQIRTLGYSVFLRYKELTGLSVDFPEDCYQGDYIIDIARGVLEEKGDALLQGEEKESVEWCAKLAANLILKGIKEDLEIFGVSFDNWFSEQTLYDEDKVIFAIEKMKKEKIIYLKDGAFWFNTSAFGDEKDRVVVRNNGLTTYFASDIAYHKDKFDRGFQRVIDVWGADHHGYIPRINAAITASGNDKDSFDVILVQLVNLLRDGEPVAMSTRSGEFETLRDVVDEVGKDAARFIFLSRHYDSHLDFDLEVAKKKTNDNPVYYVQYVHARISSITSKAADEKGINEIKFESEVLSRLVEPEEINLMKAMARYPEVVSTASSKLEPHRIAYYLMDLSSLFHSYYNKHKVLTADAELTMGRLCLINTVKILIANGLGLLGVSAPERM